MNLSKKARHFIFLSAFFASLAFGCKTPSIPQQTEYSFPKINLEWKALGQSPYIFTADYRAKNLLIHCVKLALDSPSLQIKMLPQSAEQKPVHVKDFARKNSLQVAFNTTPFLADGILKNKNKTPVGICINNGELVSKPSYSYCALGIFASEKGFFARIFASQNDEELQGADFAAGGFWQILKDGKTVQFEKIRDSRLFCALDKEGKTLFVFAVEGEKKKQTPGLTYMECAEFAKALGLENAMQFDGGASTGLVVNRESLLTYKNKVKIPACIGFLYKN